MKTTRSTRSTRASSYLAKYRTLDGIIDHLEAIAARGIEAERRIAAMEVEHHAEVAYWRSEVATALELSMCPTCGTRRVRARKPVRRHTDDTR